MMSDGEPDKGGKLDLGGSKTNSEIVFEQKQIVRTLARSINMPITTVVWTVGGSYMLQGADARHRAYLFMKDIAGVTHCDSYQTHPELCPHIPVYGYARSPAPRLDSLVGPLDS